MPVIQGRAAPGAVIHSDGFRIYNGLVSHGYRRRCRAKHGEDELAAGSNHANGTEHFWGLCRVRLARFRGVHRHTFYLHTMECGFSYNCRNQNLYLILLKNLRKHPLKLS